MSDRFDRALVIGFLILVIALTIYSMVASLAKTAYDAGMVERSTVEMRITQISATLTAVSE